MYSNETPSYGRVLIYLDDPGVVALIIMNGLVSTGLTHILYTPDLGLYLELCQHCACLFHGHVFVQVRGIQEVGHFCKNSQIITCKVSFN